MELGGAELGDPSKRRGELLAQLASEFVRGVRRRADGDVGQAIAVSPVARSASVTSTFRPWLVAR